MTVFGLNQFIFFCCWVETFLMLGMGIKWQKQTTKLRRKITAAQILRNIFSCSLISFYLLPICFCVAVLSLPHLWNTLAGEMNSDETVLVIFQKVFKKFRYQTRNLYCYVLQGFHLHLSTDWRVCLIDKCDFMMHVCNA